MPIMPVKVLGPPGTFGHEASVLAEGWVQAEYGATRTDFVKDNTDVLRAAAYGRCIGFVPAYNSDAKLVKAVMDFWLKQPKGFKSHLIGAQKVRVRHQLFIHPSITRPNRQIRAVMSHPHALHQCDEHLGRLDLWTKRVSTSTAEAARLVATNKKWRTTAAIASELAGNIYGLKVWRPNIEDSEDNFTIFHVFGPKPMEPTKSDRTVFIVRTKGAAGRFGTVLQAIRHEYSRIRSIRQISDDNAPEAAYYCVFNGHRHTDIGRRILKEVGAAGHVTVLGSYPTR